MTALHDLSITVKRGEIFGFLGPNGAGKSTTIRILLGFLHATTGRATVLGRDVATDGVAIRSDVGYLPGGIAFPDSMTGEAVLDYLSRLHGRPAPLREELIERLELSRGDLRRLVRDYSRGMRQKVGLDEPTEGLDPLMQRAFYEVLDDRRRAGRTIFFSSHILSEVERVCDRVAIIRKGELVALSDIDALLARRRRHVEARLAPGSSVPQLAGVEGVSAVTLKDDLLRCDLEGDVGPFLAAIATARITDLTIEPARLEEAFLEYYEADLAPDRSAS